MQKKGGDITNRPCGLGSVGFPRALLPVAIEAVSLESARRVVSVRGTELPLRPHCNLCYILFDSLGAFLGSLGSFLASFAVVVSHSDRGGFREPLVTVRCSVIHPRPLKAGYTAHSVSEQREGDQFLTGSSAPHCRFHPVPLDVHQSLVKCYRHPTVTGLHGKRVGTSCH